MPAGTKGEPFEFVLAEETCPSRKHAKAPGPWLTQMKVAALPQTHKSPAIARRDAALQKRRRGAASMETWGKTKKKEQQGIYLNLRVIAA